jgi:predicted  nucleic acid-binding Zn-ribbon protein
MDHLELKRAELHKRDKVAEIKQIDLAIKKREMELEQLKTNKQQVQQDLKEIEDQISKGSV